MEAVILETLIGNYGSRLVKLILLLINHDYQVQFRVLVTLLLSFWNDSEYVYLHNILKMVQMFAIMGLLNVQFFP